MNTDNKLLIGISGYARSGKNFFSSLLVSFIRDYNVQVKEYSFAQLLKEDLRELCLDKFKIDSFTENTKEKEIIRPLLIAYGECMRKYSNGTYWWNKVKVKIDADFVLGNTVAIITDARFYEEQYKGQDEIDFIRSYKNNLLFSVKQFGIGPAHISEETNMKRIEPESDAIVEWPFLDEDKYTAVEYCTKPFSLVYEKLKLNEFDNE